MIEHSGCKNLRDLGGILTRDGSRIARGRLFRGAQPSSNADLYGALGIRRVVDLRAPSERESADDPRNLWERFHIPLLEDLEPWTVPFERTPQNIGRRYLEMLEQGSSALVRILDLLGSAHLHPTLIHCVSGRDRTGIVVGCVLSLLGVSDDAIVRDYALSSVMDDAEGRHAHPENLIWFLRLIGEKHGAARGFAGSIGVADATLEALSTALLESHESPVRARRP